MTAHGSKSQVKDILLEEVLFNLGRNSSQKSVYPNLYILLFGFSFAQEMWRRHPDNKKYTQVRFDSHSLLSSREHHQCYLYLEGKGRDQPNIHENNTTV